MLVVGRCRNYLEEWEIQVSQPSFVKKQVVYAFRYHSGVRLKVGLSKPVGRVCLGGSKAAVWYGLKSCRTRVGVPYIAHGSTWSTDMFLLCDIHWFEHHILSLTDTIVVFSPLDRK